MILSAVVIDELYNNWKIQCDSSVGIEYVYYFRPIRNRKLRFPWKVCSNSWSSNSLPCQSVYNFTTTTRRNRHK